MTFKRMPKPKAKNVKLLKEFVKKEDGKDS